MVEQGLDQDPKALIPIAEVLDTIQRALVLLGSANNTISETHSSFRKYAKGDFSKTGGDIFGEAFKEVLVQKVETGSALSKAASIANKSRRFFRDLNAAERPNPAVFFFRGLGQSIRGLAWQDQLSVQNLMEREAHPRSKFCKESKCIQQTGPQSE